MRLGETHCRISGEKSNPASIDTHWPHFRTVGSAIIVVNTTVAGLRLGQVTRSGQRLAFGNYTDLENWWQTSCDSFAIRSRQVTGSVSSAQLRCATHAIRARRGN